MPCMISLAPIIQQGVLYTCLTYITERCGCHIPNIAHMDSMLHRHTHPTFLHIFAKTTNCNLYFTLLQNMCQKLICPSNWAFMPYMPNTDVLTWVMFVHGCVKYKASALKLHPVQTGTGTQTTNGDRYRLNLASQTPTRNHIPNQKPV